MPVLADTKPNGSSATRQPSPPSKFKTLDNLPLEQQAAQVQQLFMSAKDARDYENASARWREVKPRYAALQENTGL